MNLPNALGFFLLGLVMIAVPELAPALAPSNTTFGDVATLWLQFMGAVMFLIGSGYTAKCLAAELPRPAPERKVVVAAPARVGADAHSTLASTANRAAI
jgi:hypothetical protein